MTREHIVFFLSFREALRELPPELYKASAETIFDYAFEGTEPDDTSNVVAKSIFTAIRPIIDRTQARYNKCVENGRKGAEYGEKGGRPKREKPQEEPLNEPLYKEKEKEKELKLSNQRLDCENSYKFPPLRLYDSDFEQVKKKWNNTCTNFRSIAKIDWNKGKKGNRRQKVRNRLNEFKELAENGTKEEAFLFLENLFKKVNDSKFLKGDNQRGWKASFDWLFKNETNWVKVWEGNYNPEQL